MFAAFVEVEDEPALVVEIDRARIGWCYRVVSCVQGEVVREVEGFPTLESARIAGVRAASSIRDQLECRDCE